MENIEQTADEQPDGHLTHAIAPRSAEREAELERNASERKAAADRDDNARKVRIADLAKEVARFTAADVSRIEIALRVGAKIVEWRKTVAPDEFQADFRALATQATVSTDTLHRWRRLAEAGWSVARVQLAGGIRIADNELAKAKARQKQDERALQAATLEGRAASLEARGGARSSQTAAEFRKRAAEIRAPRSSPRRTTPRPENESPLSPREADLVAKNEELQERVAILVADDDDKAEVERRFAALQEREAAAQKRCLQLEADLAACRDQARAQYKMLRKLNQEDVFE